MLLAALLLQQTSDKDHWSTDRERDKHRQTDRHTKTGRERASRCSSMWVCHQASITCSLLIDPQTERETNTDRQTDTQRQGERERELAGAPLCEYVTCNLLIDEDVLMISSSNFTTSSTQWLTGQLQQIHHNNNNNCITDTTLSQMSLQWNKLSSKWKQLC